jgi:hypothetical protein
VRIGPHDVAVLFSPQIDLELARDGCAARSDTERLTIEIRSDLSPSVRHETLLHEVLHHVWNLTALPELLGEHEEVVVRSLAPILSGVVQFVDRR